MLPSPSPKYSFILLAPYCCFDRFSCSSDVKKIHHFDPNTYLSRACFRNRDAEAKLMKDVEGWEVGTWYGHPVYKVGL